MKNRFLVLIVLVCFFQMVSLSAAQVSEPGRVSLYAIVPGEESSQQPQPLRLVESSFSVRIVGFLAEVSATYEFYNPGDEEVEGVFTFPLPPGATVDGYALDIDEDMVDGVAVPKQRATVVFNEIQSRRIDPGLIEWTGRDTFKTRVYPIFPKDFRKIRIRYTTFIDEPKFVIPIQTETEIKRCFIRVEAEQLTESPKIVPGSLFPDSSFEGKGLKFEQKGETFVVEAKFFDFHPKENLVLELPKQDEQPQIVAGKADDGTVSYVLRQPVDTKNRAATVRERTAVIEKSLQNPKRVAVHWDASGSRWNADHGKEIELLRRYLDAKKPVVDLFVFRDTTESLQSFVPNDYEKLFEVLKNVPYDGPSNPTAFLSTNSTADLGLLFSDGIRKSGTSKSSSAKALRSSYPIYFIRSGSEAERAEAEAALEKFVETIFSMQHDSFETVLQGIGRVSLKASVVAQDEKETPCLTLKNSLYLAGRTNENIQVRLTLGNQEVKTLSIKADISDVRESFFSNENIPQRVWSQMKLAELLVDPIQNRAEILQHGLKYHLVTPETSLLVLESLSQYLEFKVEPPKSQAELFAKYHEKRAKYEEMYEKQAREKQITFGIKVLQRHWKMLRNWYEHDFLVPADYQYVPKYRSWEEPFARPADRSEFRRGGYGYYAGGGSGGGYGGSTGDGSFFGTGDDEDQSGVAAGKIVLQPRDAASPYLEKIRDAAKESVEKAYGVYLQQRDQYRRSPVFYCESAILFEELGQRNLAHRILDNIQELGFEDDATTQRMIGFLMLQWNCFEEAKVRFRKALELSEHDFASLRGLALAFTLQKNCSETEKDEIRAVFRNLLNECWGRFDTRNSYIDYNYLLITLLEFARCELEIGKNAAKPFELDIRIVATASHDANVGITITEPSREKVQRGNTLSIHGGAMIENAMRQMPSLSQYAFRKAGKGKYQITLELYDTPASEDEEWDWEGVEDFKQWLDNEGDDDEEDDVNKDEEDENEEDESVEKGAVFAPGVVFINIFTNYGRKNETRRSICVTLDEETDVYQIGDVDF